MTYFALSISSFPSHAPLRWTPFWPLVPSLCSIFTRSARSLVPFHAYFDFPESVDARINPNTVSKFQRGLRISGAISSAAAFSPTPTCWRIRSGTSTSTAPSQADSDRFDSARLSQAVARAPNRPSWCRAPKPLLPAPLAARELRRPASPRTARLQGAVPIGSRRSLDTDRLAGTVAARLGSRGSPPPPTAPPGASEWQCRHCVRLSEASPASVPPRRAQVSLRHIPAPTHSARPSPQSSPTAQTCPATPRPSPSRTGWLLPQVSPFRQPMAYPSPAYPPVESP